MTRFEDLDLLAEAELMDRKRTQVSQCLLSEAPAPPDDWAELLVLLTYVRDVELLADALQKCRTQLDAHLDTLAGDMFDGLADDWRMLGIQWNLAAIRWHQLATTPQSIDTTQFAYLPFFQEIMLLAQVPDAPEWLQYAVQAQLDMSLLFQAWQQMGGQVSQLPEQLQEGLQALVQQVGPATEETLALWREAGAYVALVPVLRTLARYYISTGKPNEGRLCLKQLREDLPHLPEYTPAHGAEVEMDLGHLLSNFGKVEAAKQYYAAAAQNYFAAGDDWEMQALQAQELAS